MKNERKSYSRLIIIICLLLIFPVSSSTAGNREMVEDRTQEMDDLNKQMVGQIPDLPKNGKIDAKARVTNEGGRIIFDIYQVKTAVKEESMSFGGERQETETMEVLKPDTTKKKMEPSVSKSK
ncbi:MAG: hypothetical protein ABIJ52_08930 [Pseudomonadota bacterium]|nr:hypothetical protein [Pseudomonadota bacterium]